MHSFQRPYIELANAIPSYDGDEILAELLVPWIASNGDEREWLASYARGPEAIPPANSEDLWRLYALSRVNELLLLRFQVGPFDGATWEGPAISLDHYVSFFDLIGMRVVERPRFSPFHHEIVAAEPAAQRTDLIIVTECIWPCLMLGDMLFSRAGVRVRGGASVLDCRLAQTSTLYWAYRRKGRPHQDLSHGWGSNSQWRTEFRRDYCLGETLYFNVDGRHDLMAGTIVDADDPTLDRAERIELLTNRCFVFTNKPHEDQFPYDDSFVTQVAASGI